MKSRRCRGGSQENEKISEAFTPLCLQVKVVTIDNLLPIEKGGEKRKRKKKETHSAVE